MFYVIAIGVLVAFGIYLLTRGSGSHTTTTNQDTEGPQQ